MRKWLIGILVVIVVLVGAVAYALSNLNRYLKENKDWLASQVEASLGRKVGFEEVSVSLAGGLSVRVTKLQIADDPRFSKELFVRADDVRVSVAIIPAIFGRYEVRSILLESPHVTVIRTADGFNFDSMGKPADREPPARPRPAAARAEAPPESAESAPSPAFLIAKTEIRNAELRFVDRTAKPPSDVIAKQVDFSASDVSLDSPVGLELGAALFGSPKQNVKLSGTIGPLGSPPDVQRAPLDLELELGPIVIDEVKRLPGVAGAIPPELSSPDPVSMTMELKGTPNEIAVGAKADASGAALQYGDTFRKPSGTTMRFAVDAVRTGDTVQVKSLGFRLADLEVSGSGRVTTAEPTTVDFKLDSNRAPLGGWDAMIPALAGHDVSGTFELHVLAKGKVGEGRTPALSGTLALDGMNARLKDSPHEIEGLTTRIEFREDSLTVPPTRFQLGGSPVEVEAKMESLESRRGTFRLQSPGLRAASLGVAGEEVQKEEVIRGLDLSGAFAAPAGAAPVFDGKMRSEGGSLRDVDYQDLRADFGLREDVATLRSLVLRAFDGTYDGAGSYDMRNAQAPRFDFRSNIRNMDLKPLLGEKFPGAQEKIDGRLQADLRLDGSGKDWEVIRQNLRGQGRVDVQDGVLKDVNVAEQVLTGVTGVPGLSNFISPRTRDKYPELFATGDTRFEKLGGTVNIANGEARTDDLTLAARDYTIRGEGTFALENHLDFTATLVASQRLSQDVIADVKEAKYIANEEGRIAIPFRATGSLPNVKPRPDTDYLARAIARAAVERGVEKGLEKLLGGKKRREEAAPGTEPTPDAGRELLQKGLEGLFGR